MVPQLPLQTDRVVLLDGASCALYQNCRTNRTVLELSNEPNCIGTVERSVERTVSELLNGANCTGPVEASPYELLTINRLFTAARPALSIQACGLEPSILLHQPPLFLIQGSVYACTMGYAIFGLQKHLFLCQRQWRDQGDVLVHLPPPMMTDLRQKVV